MSDLQLYDWQIKIETHEGNITIRGGRQSGKSKSTSRRIIKFAKKYPGLKTLIIAASERQENYLYDEVREILKQEDNIKGRSTLTLTTLKNGHKIFKFPVGKTGIYLEGLPSVDFLYADEAIHIGRNVWDSILPMLAEPRKRGFGWITLLSSTRGKPKGFFFDSFKRDDFLKIHVRTADQPHISQEFMEAEKFRLGEKLFKVIYEGEFDESAAFYFSEKLINDAPKIECFNKNDLEKDGNYYLGIDPARYGRSKAAFALTQLKRNDRVRVIDFELIKKSSLTELRDQILRYNDLLGSRLRKIFIDDGGLGQGLVDFLLEEKAVRKKIFPMNNRSAGKDFKILKQDLYSNLLRLLSSGKLEILNKKDIIEGLEKVEFEGPEGEEKIKGTDMSEAITRACWCVKEKNIKPVIHRF